MGISNRWIDVIEVVISSGPREICDTMPTVHLLDYVAGNVRSLANAIEKLGYTIQWIKTPSEIEEVEVCNN